MLQNQSKEMQLLYRDYANFIGRSLINTCYVYDLSFDFTANVLTFPVIDFKMLRFLKPLDSVCSANIFSVPKSNKQMCQCVMEKARPSESDQK